MKVKFLVPAIDKKKFASELRWIKEYQELEYKDFANSGIEKYNPQSVYNYMKGTKKGIQFPSMNRFLCICKFLSRTPDDILSANPKWIECEMDDISKFMVLGKVLGKDEDTYYVRPFDPHSCYAFGVQPKGYEINDDLPAWEYCHMNNILLKEPKPKYYSHFHFDDTVHNDFIFNGTKSIKDGKITYYIPYIDDEKTAAVIQGYLSEYNITRKQLEILLGLNQETSIQTREKKKQPWTLEDIYKLSWILNLPMEKLIVVNYLDETREALFSHYVQAEETSYAIHCYMKEHPEEFTIDKDEKNELLQSKIDTLQDELDDARETIAKLQQELEKYKEGKRLTNSTGKTSCIAMGI